jgi:hypothetical protein
LILCTDDWSTIKRSKSQQLAKQAARNDMIDDGPSTDLSIHRQSTDQVYKAILDDDSIDFTPKRHMLPSFPSSSSIEKEEVRRAKSELPDSNYMDSEDLFPVYPAAALLNSKGMNNGHFVPEDDVDE